MSTTCAVTRNARALKSGVLRPGWMTHRVTNHGAVILKEDGKGVVDVQSRKLRFDGGRIGLDD